MARKGRKSRKSSKMTLPVALVAPILFVGYENASLAMTGREGALQAMANITGIDNGHLNMNRLALTYGPVVAGAIIHKGAGYFGVNKALGRAKVPFLRV